MLSRFPLSLYLSLQLQLGLTIRFAARRTQRGSSSASVQVCRYGPGGPPCGECWAGRDGTACWVAPRRCRLAAAGLASSMGMAAAATLLWKHGSGRACSLACWQDLLAACPKTLTPQHPSAALDASLLAELAATLVAQATPSKFQLRLPFAGGGPLCLRSCGGLDSCSLPPTLGLPPTYRPVFFSDCGDDEGEGGGDDQNEDGDGGNGQQGQQGQQGGSQPSGAPSDWTAVALSDGFAQYVNAATGLCLTEAPASKAYSLSQPGDREWPGTLLLAGLWCAPCACLRGNFALQPGLRLLWFVVKEERPYPGLESPAQWVLPPGAA